MARGVNKLFKPSSVERMLLRLRNDIPEVVEAKQLARQGEHRQALRLLISVRKAKPEHLIAFDAYASSSLSVDDLV